MNTFIRKGVLTFAVLLAVFGTSPIRAADDKENKVTTLDDAIAYVTPDLTDAVRDLCKNDAVVGTLSFRVQIDKDKPTFKLGTLNAALADRMEITLLRGQKESDDKKVRIVRNASVTAAKARKKIDYTTAEGRKALFELKYPLLTKGEPVAADLFLTGLINIDLEKNDVTVKFFTFGPDSKDLEPLKLDGKEVVVKANVDRTLLGEAGQSFTFSKDQIDIIKRGAFDVHMPDNVSTGSAKEERKEGPKEATKKEELVKMQMFIKSGDKEIPIELTKDEGKPGSYWRTDRPLQVGDRVFFRLEPVKKDERLAVVVKVNGFSTLYETTDPPAKCAKWVLEPGCEPLVLTGFYLKDEGKNVAPFEVIPDTDATAEVLANAPGTISMHVFIEGGRRNIQPPKSWPITRGLAPRKWDEHQNDLKTLADVKQLILKENAAAKMGRGLISKSSTVEEGNKLSDTTFRDPQEVQSLTIEYSKIKP